MVCLDTDIIIDFLRKDKETIKKFSEFKENNIELKTTAINTFELFRGALRSKQENALESLSGLLTNLQILNFDFEASKKAAEIIEELRVKGEVIDHSDLMIASISIINDEILITRNTKHFKKIPELKFEN